MCKMLKKLFAAIMVMVMLVTVAPVTGAGLSVAVADAAEISLNIAEEDDAYAVLAVVLNPNGLNIGAIEFKVNAKTAKIGVCTNIEVNKDVVDMFGINTANGMVAANSDAGITDICIVATYTFAKVASEKIDCNDFELTTKNCANNEFDTVGCIVKNNLPGDMEPELGIYMISYNANGGSGAPEQHRKIETVDVYLSSVIPVREGFDFVGWSTKADGSGKKYSSGALYNADQSVTLYAMWKDSGGMEIPDSAIDGGRCGNDLYWVMYGNNELKIFGSGAMDNYSSSYPAPWKKYKDTIEKIVIEDNVKSIGKSAFEDCSSAKELFIPASVGMPDSPYTFANCAALQKITITKGNGEMCDFSKNAEGKDGKVYYKYTPWYISKCPTVEIADGVGNIGEYAFAYCPSLKSIIISDSVKTIDSYAFYSCSGPENISLPDSVTSIGSYAFYKCDSLKIVSFSVNVTAIGNAAFRYCAALEKVYFDGTGYEWKQLGYNDWSDPQPEIIFLVVHGSDDHEFKLIAEVEETCTTDGSKSYLCRCGETYTDVFKAQGHKFGDWIILEEPTCTKDGSKRRVCSACKFKETVTIPALGMVHSVSVSSITLNYKESAAIPTKIDVDENVDYTVSYTSSDPSVAQVDANGNVYASGKGSATINCTVTDEYGNVVKDSCTVYVEYTFGQWLLVILLFGWIWY